MRRKNLMGQNLGPGIGELTAFVASQESSGEHLQLEAPGIIPLAARCTLKRRVDTLKLGKKENLVFGTIRRLHEDRRVEFDLGMLATNFLNMANTVMLVEFIRAANKIAFVQFW